MTGSRYGSTCAASTVRRSATERSVEQHRVWASLGAVSTLPRADHARSGLRVLQVRDADRPDLIRLINGDPLVNAVVASRVRSFASVETRAFGGSVLGVWDRGGRLSGAAFCGGNLMPIGGGDAQWSALAASVAAHRRTCSSLVGRADAVRSYWQVLKSYWGPARAIRDRQLLLVIERAASPPTGDPRVRQLDVDEVEAYLPAAIAMFTAELGVSPLAATGAAGYRRRVAGLLREGRALGVVDGAGQVLFKADIGAVSADTCQVVGVWVRPDLRGRGFGTAAMASVLRHALTLAPTVSLYVNDFNSPACRMYLRLGMRHAADLSTVLF